MVGIGIIKETREDASLTKCRTFANEGTNVYNSNDLGHQEKLSSYQMSLFMAHQTPNPFLNLAHSVSASTLVVPYGREAHYLSPTRASRGRSCGSFSQMEKRHPVHLNHATRWPNAKTLRSISSRAVANACVEQFLENGIPREILSDNGPQSLSATWDQVCNLLNINQIHTSPY